MGKRDGEEGVQKRDGEEGVQGAIRRVGQRRWVLGHLSWVCRRGGHWVKRSHVGIFPLNSLLRGRTVMDALDNLGPHQRCYITEGCANERHKEMEEGRGGGGMREGRKERWG